MVFKKIIKSDEWENVTNGFCKIITFEEYQIEDPFIQILAIDDDGSLHSIFMEFHININKDIYVEMSGEAINVQVTIK